MPSLLRLHFEPQKLPNFDFNAVPPDPGSQKYADPYRSGSATLTLIFHKNNVQFLPFVQVVLSDYRRGRAEDFCQGERFSRRPAPGGGSRQVSFQYYSHKNIKEYACWCDVGNAKKVELS
jgi:hypothetical protein